MFSSDKAEYGALPNTNLSSIALAYPGTLPQVNRKAFEHAIKLGLACASTITEWNCFARKSYFYPDLPKGFQITQDTTPICRGGFVSIQTQTGVNKNIPLIRMHLEEDTGKSVHGLVEGITLLDYNRAGTPLLELVTAPEIRSGAEAYQFLTELRKLVRYLEICDGNMEEASLRCDANISIRSKGAQQYGTRVEVKNMNSMRNVERAIAYETQRQIALLEAGEAVVSETRYFQATSGKTIGLRTKETAADYRYFPEPDIPPIVVSQASIDRIRATMPLLPSAFFSRFVEEYGLSHYAASVITESKAMALFFEAVCQHTAHQIAAANWLIGPVKGYLNQQSLVWEEFPLAPHQIAALTELVESGLVGFSIAVDRIFPLLMEEKNASPEELAQRLELIQNQDSDALIPLVSAVLAEHPEKVMAYKQGKKGLLAMFVGEIRKRNPGVNCSLLSNLLQEQLER